MGGERNGAPGNGHCFVLQTKINRSIGEVAQRRRVRAEPLFLRHQDISRFGVPVHLHQHRCVVVGNLRIVRCQDAGAAQYRLGTGDLGSTGQQAPQQSVWAGRFGRKDGRGLHRADRGVGLPEPVKQQRAGRQRNMV